MGAGTFGRRRRRTEAENRRTDPGYALGVDPVEFLPVQRRKLLMWGWGSVAVVLVGVAGVALAPHIAGGGTGLLFLPGLVALILAPLTLNVGYGRTVLSDRGLRTRTLFRRHSCSWSDVAVIDSKTTLGARGTRNTRVLIRLASGRSFSLAAPFDSNNGADPQFERKLMQIQGYWHAHQGVSASS
jgi:hypothetical protein